MRIKIMVLVAGLALSTGTGFAAGSWTGGEPHSAVRDTAPATAPWRWDEAAGTVTGPQNAFPCYEDEVLGFDPRVGAGRVGCLHLDYVVDRG